LYDKTIVDKNECKSNVQVNQVIEQQEMKCGNEDCQWNGNYFEYKLKHKNNCEFQRISCENERSGCDEKISKKNMKEHGIKCEFRRVDCEFCDKREIIFKEIQNHHEIECEGNKIQCPNECGISIIFKDKLIHLNEGFREYEFNIRL
jgi:hypothetical protein